MEDFPGNREVLFVWEAIAGLPLHLYRYTGSGGKEKAVEHPLYFLLHDEPNPEMTSFVFRDTLFIPNLQLLDTIDEKKMVDRVTDLWDNFLNNKK